MTNEFPDKLSSKIRLSKNMMRMFSPFSGICVELPIDELFIFTIFGVIECHALNLKLKMWKRVSEARFGIVT